MATTRTKIDLAPYDVKTSEFAQVLKTVRDNVAKLLSLTAKVYSAPGKVTVTLNNGSVITFGKKEVRTMWTSVLKDITDLRRYYDASKRKKKSKRKNAGSAFEDLVQVKQYAIDFFSRVNMGYVSPVLTPVQTVVNGKTIMSPIGEMGQVIGSIDPENGGLLTAWLTNPDRNAAIMFQNKVSKRVIVNILFYIYARVNNLRSLAAVNQGKPYVQWQTAMLGATDELAGTFSEGFAKIANNSASRGGNFGVRGFRSSDFSTITATIVEKNPQLDIKAQAATPEQGSEILKMYLNGTKQFSSTKNLKNASNDVWGARMSQAQTGFQQVAAQAGNLPGSNDAVRQILSMYAMADMFQLSIQFINHLHGTNYDAINKVRSSARKA